MTAELPVAYAGYYTQPYRQIVQPDRIWPVSKYFLRRWVPYLTPLRFWTVVAARQLAYAAGGPRDTFRAYHSRLAEEACIARSQYKRVQAEMEDPASPISLFISREPLEYERRDGKTMPKPTVYHVRLDDPLTPADAFHLTGWLMARAADRRPAAVAELLTAARQQSGELLAPEIKPYLADTPAEFKPLFVLDVVERVFGGAVAAEEAVRAAADGLHQQLTGAVYLGTHYFRRHWVDRLGAGPAHLVAYLRSYTYVNEESGEIRDQVTLTRPALADALNVDRATLYRWMKKIAKKTAEEQPFEPFLTELDSTRTAENDVAVTYRVAVHDPLLDEDLPRYRELLAAQELPDAAASGGGEPAGSTPAAPATDPSPRPPSQNELYTGGEKAGPPVQNGPYTVGANPDPPLQNELHTAATDSRGPLQNELYTDAPTDGGGVQNGPHTRSDSPPVLQNEPHDRPEAPPPLQNEPGSVAKRDSHPGGALQKEPASVAEWAAIKQYKKLAAALEIEIQDLAAATASHSVENDPWKIQEQRATHAFATAAVGDFDGLFRTLGIHGTRVRRQLQESGLDLAGVLGWQLYALTQHGLADEMRVGYVINRVRSGEPPPAPFGQLAHQPWASWRVYACLLLLPPYWHEGFREETAYGPWMRVYGRQRPDQLPLGVGSGVGRFVERALALTEEKSISAADPGARGGAAADRPVSPDTDALWQQVLDDLALQLPRETYELWLADARLTRAEENLWVIGVRTPQAQAWLSRRLAGTVRRAMSAASGADVAVRFVVSREI